MTVSSWSHSLAAYADDTKDMGMSPSLPKFHPGGQQGRDLDRPGSGERLTGLAGRLSLDSYSPQKMLSLLLDVLFCIALTTI